MLFNLKEESTFIQSCITSQVNTVSILLEQVPSLANTPASDGSYPLMFAVESKFLELIEKLLKCGAEIDAIPNTGPFKGVTALWCAFYWKKWEAAKWLLEAGAGNLDVSPIEGKDRGKTVLWLAAANKQWDLVELLLMKGVKNLNAGPAEGVNRGKTVMWLLAANKQWNLFVLLLKKGAGNLDTCPVEGQDRGLTILWMAADWYRWDIVKLVLEAGVDNVDASPAEGAYRGSTALWMAAATQRWDMIKCLLDAGARYDVKPEEGPEQDKTVLWWVLEYGNHAILHILLTKGNSEKTILELSKSLTPEHQKKLYDVLGEVLEKTLPRMTLVETFEEMPAKTLSFSPKANKLDEISSDISLTAQLIIDQPERKFTV